MVGMRKGTGLYIFGILVTIGSVFFGIEVNAATLPSPIITAITRGSDGASVVVTGKSEANTTVHVQVTSAPDNDFYRADAIADSQGAWQLEIPDSSFPAGDYMLRAVAYASDGSVSAPREIRGHKLQPTPVIDAAGFAIGWFDLFMAAIFLAIVAAAVFGYLHERALHKRDIDRLMHDQNMHALCTSLCDDINELAPLSQSLTHDHGITEQLNSRIMKLQATLEQMQRHLAVELQKFNR
jgi:hypothetical protein